MDEISDGRFYDLNDMVKAGCEDCKGCSACCHGMGASIVLDPLDVYRLEAGTRKTFEQLLAEHLELNVVDGIIQPNLKLTGAEEGCTFLNAAGRCTIHQSRPGICRLFPLGRYYEDGKFRYFLQVHECTKTNRTKVKVRKWIDTPDAVRYDAFITEWHYFLKDLQELLTDENVKDISMYVLKLFFMYPYQSEADFYPQFDKRMSMARAWRERLGVPE